MGVVIGLTPEIQRQLDLREAALHRRANRMSKLRNRLAPLAVLTAVTGFAAVEVMQDNDTPKPPTRVEACLAEGHVAEWDGYISGIEDASARYGLGLDGVMANTFGQTLQQEASSLSQVAHPNQYIHIGINKSGALVAGLGSCASAGLPPAAATPQN